MTREDQALTPNEADSTASLDSNPQAEPLEVIGEAGASAGLSEDELAAQEALHNLEQRRAQKRRKKIVRLVAACAIAGGLLAVVMGKFFAPTAEADSVEPELAAVERMNFSDYVSASGALKAGSTVVVSPEVDGIVESIKVQEGQSVKEGDVLLTLKNDSLDKAVRSAEQDVRSAEQNLASAQTEVSQANAARDDAWRRYNEEWAKADELHQEWAYLEENYDELYMEWEERYDYAQELACGKPIEPVAPAQPPANASEEQKQKYETDFAIYQQKYSEYLEKSDAYAAYQDALSKVGEEPTPAGDEPQYPESPDDIALTSAINSANDGVTSANEALTKARDALKEANEDAEKRTVKAPSDGSVVSIDVKVGQAVGGASGGTSEHASDGPLVTIADVNKMSVDIEVNEIDILSIRKGQKASVTFSAVPDLELAAKVQEVSTSASTEGEGGVVTFHVGLVIPHPDEQLRPGMTASVKIDTVDVPDALVIPASALIEDGASTSVEVVTNEETLETELRLVKVGARNSMEAVIEDGLEEGDVIVVSGGSASASEGDEEA